MFSLRRLIKNYDETGLLNARMRVYVEKLMADPRWESTAHVIGNQQRDAVSPKLRGFVKLGHLWHGLSGKSRT
jgi:hypothetical protein